MEEEEMMVMIRDLHQIIYEQDLNTFTTWKLYQNPIFKSHQQQKTHYYHHHYNHHQHQIQSPPLSARKLAASLWDLNSYQSIMGSHLDLAKTQIRELKQEVEFERKLRKKVESMNKKLGKELKGLRKNSEALERLCEELVKEISLEKTEINRMKREIEEERKMMRMAEVLREERVQMKFAEAKVVFEEKLLELELVKEVEIETLRSKLQEKKNNNMGLSGNESAIMGSCELHKNNNNGDDDGIVRSIVRIASSEAENPHIKRGIKGFVEFPKVVRAISSRGRQLGSKLECQKAQLRLLLRQKSPFRTNNLIMG